MKCSSCGEREGVVSLTQVKEGEVHTSSLCAQCAAEKGIETGFAMADTPLGGFLAKLGESVDPDAPLTATLEVRCPGCDATLRDFRETGRVGCSQWAGISAPSGCCLPTRWGSSPGTARMTRSCGIRPTRAACFHSTGSTSRTAWPAR